MVVVVVVVVMVVVDNMAFHTLGSRKRHISDHMIVGFSLSCSYGCDLMKRKTLLSYFC